MTAQLALAWEAAQTACIRQTPARQPRHLCAACHEHPARFQYRGVVKADRSHTLCFRCYRSAMDSARTFKLASRLADKYDALSLRRRRAQIAARHALETAEAAAESVEFCDNTPSFVRGRTSERWTVV